MTRDLSPAAEFPNATFTEAVTYVRELNTSPGSAKGDFARGLTAQDISASCVGSADDSSISTHMTSVHGIIWIVGTPKLKRISLIRLIGECI